jgi:hypothetical protein
MNLYFGLPHSIVFDQDVIFLGNFWITLWERMDNKLNNSTTFHS